jgi:hypothetical protein
MHLAIYVAGLVAFLLSLKWPHLGLYYLIPLLPAQTVRYGFHQYPLGGSMIDLVLLGVLIGSLLQGTGSVFSGLPMKKLLLVYAVYVYLSLWNGAIFLGGSLPLSTADLRVSNWKGFMEMPALFVVAFAGLRTRQHIKTAIVLMCVATLVVSMLFYRDMHTHDLSHFSNQTENIRGSGVLGYAGANGLAAFEVGVAIFLLGFYSFKLPLLAQLGSLVVLLGCCYGVLFTFSRAAYIAMGLGIVFIGFVQKRSLLILATVGVLLSPLILPTSVLDRISGTYVQPTESGEQKLEGSAEKRLLILKAAIPVVMSNPIVGIGFDTWRYLHPVGNLKDTHDYYLRVLAEEGVVGLWLFLAVIWGMFRHGYSLFRNSRDALFSSLGLGLAACMLGAMVVNAFGDRWSYIQVDSYWWILLALVGRARLLESKANAEEEAAPGVGLEAQVADA